MASLTASTKLATARRVTLRTQAKTPRPMRAHRLICRAARDPADTLDKVTKIIAGQLGTEVDKVKPEADFVSLGADSLDVVEIIMGLEEEFGIEIDQEVAATLKDVQAVANYIATN